LGWFWSGGADGARGVLSVVAGSVMTVVSIVFSLTITTLAQTSAHFGPRVLRNFTSDRGVQFTLGTFIATFVYCLLVLRTVRSAGESGFVPYLAVNFGVILALASLGVLIFFIHRVSQAIQAENLIAEVGRGFQNALTSLFPEQIGEPEGKEPAPDSSIWKNARTVVAAGNGYVQRVDDAGLLALARQHSLQLMLDKRPGDFVARETLLLAAPEQRMTQEIEYALRDCFILGGYRTPHQDARYSLQQLVEIAVHALSPGINEPFTALTCIDWIGAGLRGVAARDFPRALRHDEDGALRVIARPVTFAELASTSFDQIRLYGVTNPEIAKCLLKIIAGLAPCLRRQSDREVLMKHAQHLGDDAAQIRNRGDHEHVVQHLQRALLALASPTATGGPALPAT
jgi:uncharacterized membrane protein